MAGDKYTTRRPRRNEKSNSNTPCDTAVVKPVKGKRSLSADSPVVLVGTSGDLDNLVRSMLPESIRPQPLFNSRLYIDPKDPPVASLVGPMVGAPYAAMLLETLIVWGARQFIFFGWCGAISPEVKIGDLMVPHSAIIDEGTSVHYRLPSVSPKVSQPSSMLLDRIRWQAQASQEKITFREGAVWTTDAIFRETPEKIRHFLTQGALAVDMETSALFSVARYRDVKIGGILIVSDELSSLIWLPGFKSEAFSSGRQKAYEVIRRTCHLSTTLS